MLVVPRIAQSTLALGDLGARRFVTKKKDRDSFRIFRQRHALHSRGIRYYARILGIKARCSY